MKIRNALPKDTDKIGELLVQVLNVHNEVRPDIFHKDSRKYTDDDLLAMISDETTPIFVAVDENDEVMGYAMCQVKTQIGSSILKDNKTLYIDDICVDEQLRGRHIGQNLFEHVKFYAQKIKCNNITLNVWADNQNAYKFYQKLGMRDQRHVMELML
jgi:ribosomal protein S18 acetylase RimI-like enzyme